VRLVLADLAVFAGFELPAQPRSFLIITLPLIAEPISPTT